MMDHWTLTQSMSKIVRQFVKHIFFQIINHDIYSFSQFSLCAYMYYTFRVTKSQQQNRTIVLFESRDSVPLYEKFKKLRGNKNYAVQVNTQHSLQLFPMLFFLHYFKPYIRLSSSIPVFV